VARYREGGLIDRTSGDSVRLREGGLFERYVGDKARYREGGLIDRQTGDKLRLREGGTVDRSTGDTVRLREGGLLTREVGDTVKLKIGGTLDKVTGDTVRLREGGYLSRIRGDTVKLREGGTVDRATGDIFKLREGGRIDKATGDQVRLREGGRIEKTYGDRVRLKEGSTMDRVSKTSVRLEDSELLEAVTGQEKETESTAVVRNYESEKSERRRELKELLKGTTKSANVIRRAAGGMLGGYRRMRSALDTISLGTAIRRVHGGLIKGPGSGTSDSIPGVIVDSNGVPQRGVLVSNGEAILNAAAVSKLGKGTIDWINKNPQKLATGGIVNHSAISNITNSVMSQPSQYTPIQMPDPVDVNEMSDVLYELMSGRGPSEMRLQVSDSALNRTLKDYVEDYFADVVATR
jgi:hypothetical protein